MESAQAFSTIDRLPMGHCAPKDGEDARFTPKDGIIGEMVFRTRIRGYATLLATGQTNMGN